ADVPKEEDTNERYDDALLNQLFTQSIDRMINQCAAVVGRNHSHTRRERAAHFFDFLLDPIDHFECVLAIPHDHHATDDFPFAIQVRDAITQIRTEMYRGYILDVNRRAILR